MSSAFQVKADMSCFGKALGGGLPLSACVGTESVMNAWPTNSGEALHTGTFFGHPLACDLGIATLQTICSQNLDQRAQSLGHDAQKFLKELLASNSDVVCVRGEGLMIGIELKQDFAGVKLTRLLRERGIIVLPCGEKARCLSITPALNISQKDFFEALTAISDCINEYTRHLPV